MFRAFLSRKACFPLCRSISTLNRILPIGYSWRIWPVLPNCWCQDASFPRLTSRTELCRCRSSRKICEAILRWCRYLNLKINYKKKKTNPRATSIKPPALFSFRCSATISKQSNSKTNRKIFGMIACIGWERFDFRKIVTITTYSWGCFLIKDPAFIKLTAFQNWCCKPCDQSKLDKNSCSGFPKIFSLNYKWCFYRRLIFKVTCFFFTLKLVSVFTASKCTLLWTKN